MTDPTNTVVRGTLTDVVKEIDKMRPAVSWLQRHERLVLVVIAAVCLLWCGNHWLNNTAAHDKLAATAAAQTLEAQKQTNAQLAAQVAQSTEKYQALVVSVTAQNSQLAAAAQSRTVVLQAQQKTDSTLDAAGIAARLTALEKLQAGAVTVTQSPQGNGMIGVDMGAGQTIVQGLDSIPVLQLNLAAAQTELSNCQAVVKAGDAENQAETLEITGLNKQITDADVSCKATVASVKADARKSKWHSFLGGLGIGAGAVGVLVGLVASHAL